MRDGTQFGRYRIEHLLGFGGMGAVYRAYDPILRRHVALKVLLEASGTGATDEALAQARAQVLREARAAAALSHPNAVSIFDVGEIDGTPFLAMELLDGKPLRAYVGDADVPHETRLAWLLAIARALAAAHARGLVHQDVKPDNVMVCADGTIRVLDFGIAVRSRDPEAPDAPPSSKGAEVPKLRGTPRYMSPEQILGEKVDGRSDQFAWGIVAYELITGEHPWVGESGPTQFGMLNDPPRSPKSGGSTEVMSIVERSLEKRPEQRFESMSQVVTALETMTGRSSAPRVPDACAVGEPAATRRALEAPQPHEAARSIGRYVIHDVIAAGGMATVHFGRLIGPVGFTRTVAIKRLHTQYAHDPEFVAMLMDEARLAARIRHPNVVPTLDIVSSSSELFLVMDYVQGEPLSRLCRLAAARDERPPLRVVTSIFCGVLHGLHAAHEAKSDAGALLGIVHRDVSPQNILVGADGVARLLDFGVAKALGRSQVTRDGHLKGKLAYMAPEQLEGRATRQTDLFALGVVLWETLTEQRLFAGQDDADVVGKILNREVEPPSKMRRQAPDGPDHAGLDRLDAVTLRALERRPVERFETAREMALALESCIGVASPMEVATWVERIAGGVLDERSKRVSEIESQTSPVDTTPQPSLRFSSGDPHAYAETATAELGSQASSVSLARNPPASRPPSWAMSAGVAVVAAIAVSSAFALLSARGSVAPAHESAGVSASRADPAPESPPPAPPPSPSGAALADPPAPSIAPSTAPSAGELRGGLDAAVRPSSRGSTGASRGPDCTIPYTVDSAGHRHFKEECFH